MNDSLANSANPTPLDPAVLDVLDRIDWRTMRLMPAFGSQRVRDKSSEQYSRCLCPLETAFTLNPGDFTYAPVVSHVRTDIIEAADWDFPGTQTARAQRIRAEMLRRIDLGTPAQRIEVTVTEAHLNAALASRTLGWNILTQCAAGQACQPVPGFASCNRSTVAVAGHAYQDANNNLCTVVDLFDGGDNASLRAKLPLTLDLRLIY